MTPARVDLGKIWANAPRFLVAQAALRVSASRFARSRSWARLSSLSSALFRMPQ
jgi:hypothetical protein